MKAITLWQPWASLLACGAKQYETRSWATNYRGQIAIHAAKGMPAANKLMSSISVATVNTMMDALGLNWQIRRLDDLYELPRGYVVATAELVGCHEVTHATYPPGGGQRRLIVNDKGDWRALLDKELLFGDFSVGRYAWEFVNMKMLDKPIPAKGGQRIWNWEPPVI